MDVYVLHHVHALGDGTEDVKLIGVYSTKEKADAAVAALSVQPGFSGRAEGFETDAYEVDKTHWLQGFVTPPPDEEAS